METTNIGMNRTGAKLSPAGTQAMTEAVNELAPPEPIDNAATDAERLVYINEAESVGSVPPPASVKGVLKAGMAKVKGSHPSVFFDKLGERIAFERGGVRLYEALIVKHQAVGQMGQEMLPPAEEVMDFSAEGMFLLAPVQGERPAETLARIRGEELEHFHMLCQSMEQLGGDPTAMTPCADVQATASMGIVQVLTDPRTTLAQCLNAILTAELTDNAGWELLITLAEDAGEYELAGRFLGALAQEQEHVAVIKGWLTALLSQGAGTPAV
ncbi:MAG TPA: ferritin-like domain-containing protein [Ramlibacter sp.]